MRTEHKSLPASKGANETACNITWPRNVYFTGPSVIQQHLQLQRKGPTIFFQHLLTLLFLRVGQFIRYYKLLILDFVLLYQILDIFISFFTNNLLIFNLDKRTVLSVIHFMFTFFFQISLSRKWTILNFE